MSKRAILAATAMVAASFNPVLMTPAWAIPPVQDTSGLTPQEVCDAQLLPNNPNSEFSTIAENISAGPWEPVGNPVPTDPIGDPYGVGTPTSSNIFLENSYFRNGGSPNVWAEATATLTYPQTGQMYETEVTQRQTTTFDCHVHKDTPGSHVEPEGLQSFGNSTIEEDVGPGEPVEVITDEDFILEGQTIYALICISPNNATKGKPGTWTKKHGFTGDCDAASVAAGGPVPSGNAPSY